MNRKYKWLDSVLYSFPVQLLLIHFKKNQVMLAIWVLLFAIVFQQFGRVVGVPYLFLDPEYLDTVSFRSLLILGMAAGGFTMSFHITSYILDGHRFAFLGTLPKPFIKFCLNNSIIPLTFLISYLYCFCMFQFSNGFQNLSIIFLQAFGFLLGYTLIQMLIFLYFRLTNTDVFKLLSKNLDNQLKKNMLSRGNILKRLDTAQKSKYRVDNYLSFPEAVKKVDPFASLKYNKESILKVFDQNHLNAVFLEIFVIALVALISLFKESIIFQFPAAASGMLFCSIFIMLTGALSYWLRGWAITSVIAGLFFINFMFKNGYWQSEYPALGINYKTEKADYSLENLQNLSTPDTVARDIKAMHETLGNWKSKFKSKKPKMILLCVSGGGQRAAVWTFNVLQKVDSITEGEFFNHTFMITGASGGMIGAAYYREIYLRHLQGKIDNPYHSMYLRNIGKDILNPVIFSMVSNDLLFKIQKVKYDGRRYSMDRGYAFEQALNRNTNGLLEKKLMDYKIPESSGLIPLQIFSPTVVNDGRKLYLSAQKISFMNLPSLDSRKLLYPRIRGIEFSRFFACQDAKNLRYLTALRMNATFPYVTPNVILPSMPTMEIMDAGLSDNFGLRDAIKFSYIFKEWIEQNTSGVIIVSIRDSGKDPVIDKNIGQSMYQKFFNPIGSLYNNWSTLQDVQNDNLLNFAQSWVKPGLEIVEFRYEPKNENWDLLKEKNIDPKKLDKKLKQERASLSWHLTTREKESLYRTIYEPNNVYSLDRLSKSLGTAPVPTTIEPN